MQFAKAHAAMNVWLGLAIAVLKADEGSWSRWNFLGLGVDIS